MLNFSVHQVTVLQGVSLSFVYDFVLCVLTVIPPLFSYHRSLFVIFVNFQWLRNPSNLLCKRTSRFFLIDYSCYNGTGKSYLGRKNVSRSGRPCLPWPNLDPPGHNFCRNPDGLRESPWCYVGPNHEEYCAVDKCSYKPLAVG